MCAGGDFDKGLVLLEFSPDEMLSSVNFIMIVPTNLN